jgi:succinyl-CoA synthetase alpha subunit
MGVAALGGAKLAQIAVPGPYAAAEALKALKAGLHVFLFSDNVPLAEELAVKRLAARKGLLVMGPDCGTAILGGVPLGFANAVRRGAIGLVGASGTGMQEVSCRIHALGEGVSHAIGTGSRDVYEEVGGTTLVAGLEALGADPATTVIGIVSKPPAPSVAERALAVARATGKPTVCLFLGANPDAGGNLHPAATLEEAAAKAVALARGGAPASSGPAAAPPPVRLAPTQRFLRGLYSGGTYCIEAQLVWRSAGLETWSNAPLEQRLALAHGSPSRGHTAIDLGADEFTLGRPHPMIDFAARLERLAAEALDPSVAAIVIDVVLGYGAHPDPAGALAPAVRAARAAAVREGRELAVIGFLCGTEGDPQELAAQAARLAESGMVLAPCSTAAARLAAGIVARR